MADGSLLGDAGNGDGGLRERRLETEKFQMGRSFVLVDGSSLGDAGSDESGLRERQKEWRLETKKEGECERECLGVKKFQRVR